MDDAQAKQIQLDWARHPDDTQFQGDAVEWWDVQKDKWRPTVLAEILLEPTFPRKRALIYVPCVGGMELIEVKLAHLRPARALVKELGDWFGFQPQMETAKQLKARHEEITIAAMGIELKMMPPTPVDQEGNPVPDEMVDKWIEEIEEEGKKLCLAWVRVFEKGAELDPQPVEFDPSVWGLGETKKEREL